MRTDQIMRWRWLWPRIVGVALAQLSLLEIGLPVCLAQLEFNGGYVQTHREDGAETLNRTVPLHGTRPPGTTPPSYFPDYDFYYPYYYSATAPTLRSFYFLTGMSGSQRSTPEDEPLYGISASVLPWNQDGFKDYDVLPNTVQNSTKKYSLEAMALPSSSSARLDAAVLIAHLPEHAVLWVDGKRTRSTGRTRYFQSPPLRSGRQYSYTVSSAWIENNRWVSQIRKIPVRAGLIEAIYLRSR